MLKHGLFLGISILTLMASSVASAEEASEKCLAALLKPKAGKSLPVDISSKTGAFLGKGPAGKFGIFVREANNAVFYPIPDVPAGAPKSKSGVTQKLLLKRAFLASGRPLAMSFWRSADFDASKGPFGNSLTLAETGSGLVSHASKEETKEITPEVVSAGVYEAAVQDFVRSAASRLADRAENFKMESQFAGSVDKGGLTQGARKELDLSIEAVEVCKGVTTLDMAAYRLNKIAPTPAGEVSAPKSGGSGSGSGASGLK